MKNWKNILIDRETTILKAIEIIDANAMGIAIVVDKHNRLLGTVTDGDIRRAILKGMSLDEDQVSLIMNEKPTVAQIHEGRDSMLALMRQKDLKQIPVVDEEGCVVNVEVLHDLIQFKERDNWVILMAGGLGKRLGALTSNCPKPLLNVGNKPILETILQSFIEHGFRRFYITVNYKAEMIEEYFGDGSDWGVEIRYIREEKQLGTAGALSLLPEKLEKPFLVMNGDLLTKVNFNYLLDFHIEHQATATMCVREYNFQVPYGVVQIDKHRLVGIVEKPNQKFFVSAGVYVLDPAVLDVVPQNSYYDMPTLFEKLINKDYETAVFPIREYWLDIGRVDDFKRANSEFSEVFDCD